MIPRVKVTPLALIIYMTPCHQSFLIENNIFNSFEFRKPSHLLNELSSFSDYLKISESERSTQIHKRQQPKRERPRIPVLQYHDDWVCVNKPAGIAVHRSAKTPRSQFVLSTLLKRQLSRKVFPVHRLDFRTSGAILFAFDSETCGLLHKSLTYGNASVSKANQTERRRSITDLNNNGSEVSNGGQRSSQKEYIALLRGCWNHKFGEKKVVTVEKPLNVDGVTKHAVTDFHLLACYPGPKDSLYHPSACSLVLCKPKTGRTHQIRRHAYSLGFPVIGDTQHGDSKINRWWRVNYGLNRLFLHCLCLDLPPIFNINSSILKVRSETRNRNRNGSCTVANEDTGSNFITTTDQEDRIYCVAPLPLELSNTLQRGDLMEIWNKATKTDSRLLREHYDERGGTFGRDYKKSIR